MRLLKRLAIALLGVLFLVAGLSACSTSSEPSAVKSEAKARDGGYEALAARQPGRPMTYSPTRASLNFWSETWDHEGKLSYVYLLASNGQLVGYYVFEGLPVSYCASLYPTYDIHDGYDVADFPVPAPSLDGVYYSGNQCTQYFGKDATTGSYIEYATGQGITPLVYEEPLARQDVEPLGFTVIK